MFLFSVIKQQQQYLKQLDDLMSAKDTIDIRYLKTFLVGPPGVGKTTTLNRLLKVITNILSVDDGVKIPSTLLANCIQVFAFVSCDGAEWISSSDLNQEAKLLFHYLCGCKLVEVSSKPSSSIQKSILSDSEQKHMQRSRITIERSQESNITHKVVSTEEVLAQDQRSQECRIHNFIARLQKLIKIEDNLILMNLLGSTLLNINDIGGQPGFLEMLPALSIGPAMYLVFFDLGKELDKPYKIPFNREDTVITPYDAVHTVKATISQILSAITSVHCTYHETSFVNMSKAVSFHEKFRSFQKVKPLATLIDTHRDKLQEPVQEKLTIINDQLKNTTENYSQVIVNPSVNSTLFAVDNYAGTEQSDIGPIREFMSKIFRTHFKEAMLPIRSKWLWLSLILRREYIIVSRTNCLDFAKSLGMDEGEVDFALWYLHFCTGTLMYYPDISDEWFKNHIICSPQVVFDSISQLIVASLRTLHCDGPVVEEQRAELIKLGQFSIESIEKYCTSAQVIEKLEKDELIPAKQLVKLLQHVNLLCPVTHTEVGVIKRITYLMPAVLGCASLDKLTTPPPPDDNNPEPMHITFSCGYVPTGTFCGLITQLVSRGPHGILGLTWDLVEHRVKRNFVQFHVDYSNKVTLMCHDRCYELRVERNNSDIMLHDLCTHVLSVILYILKNLYKNLITQIAFRCPCTKHSACRGVDNLCTLISTKTSTKFYCERCPVTLNAAQNVWIGKVSVLY